MKRPTIADIAQQAGVGVSTVDRVLNGRAKVRKETFERVSKAMHSLGYRNLGGKAKPNSSLDHAPPTQATNKQRYRFGVLLQQGSHAFYQTLAQALQLAAATSEAFVELKVEFMDELDPRAVAAAMCSMGMHVDALGVVAADHPHVTEAIEHLAGNGVPVFAIISELSASVPVGYVGLDNRKVGRTAGWVFQHMCHTPGKIGVIIGSHRFRCQEFNEIGFRSYIREHQSKFELLEPVATLERQALAREQTRILLDRYPDLVGLFISGGGIAGVIAALREEPRSRELVCVGYELAEDTRSALLDGTLKLVISHPLPELASSTISAMCESMDNPRREPRGSKHLVFEIHTREHL